MKAEFDVEDFDNKRRIEKTQRVQRLQKDKQHDKTDLKEDRKKNKKFQEQLKEKYTQKESKNGEDNQDAKIAMKMMSCERGRLKEKLLKQQEMKEKSEEEREL